MNNKFGLAYSTKYNRMCVTVDIGKKWRGDDLKYYAEHNGATSADSDGVLCALLQMPWDKEPRLYPINQLWELEVRNTPETPPATLPYVERVARRR